MKERRYIRIIDKKTIAETERKPSLGRLLRPVEEDPVGLF